MMGDELFPRLSTAGYCDGTFRAMRRMASRGRQYSCRAGAATAESLHLMAKKQPRRKAATAFEKTGGATVAPPAAVRPSLGASPGGHPHTRLVLATVCVGLVVACIAIYGQTISHGFVNYDDDLYVTDNADVQTGLTLKSVGWAFVTEKALYFHPLTWMSLMLDHDLYGMHAGGYHVTNLILHAASSVLLFLALRLLTGAFWPSAAVAALFAVHPLNVESVAWVAERKGVLSAFFWMLALGAYGRYARRGGVLRYAAVAAAFLGGLMSKPMVLTLPCALLLLDCWPLGRVSLTEPWGVMARKAARLALEKIPLFLLTALSALSTFVMQARGHNIDVAGKVSLATRYANAMVVYVLYILKTLWPSGLAAFYPYPASRPLWQAGGAALTLAAISLLCLSQARRRPYLIVGWLWYLGTLAPVIGLVRIGDFSHADRYTYLPSLGLYFMAVWGIADLVAAWKPPKRAVAAAAGAALAALALCSGIQTGHWHDSKALFSHAVNVGQESYLAHNNLGVFAIGEEHYDEARASLVKALDLNPTYVPALGNLSKCALDQGFNDEAKTYLKKELELRPDSVKALNSLGKIAAEQGHPEEARTYLIKALSLDPKDVEVLYNLGVVARDEKRYDEAKVYLNKALDLDPGYFKALNNLGVTAMEQGHRDEAVTCFKRVLELNPDHANALSNLGKLAMDDKRLDEAATYLKKALDLDPKCIPARHNLGLCLLNQGQYEEAQTQFRKALEINPQYVRSMKALGEVLARLGRREESDSYIREAAELEQGRTTGK